MSKRQFWVLLALAFVVLGPVGYFTYRVQLNQHKTQIELEKERTERSENRWDKADKMLQRLPFTKKN